MVEHATDQELKGAIQEHLEQTRQHAVNVERVFTELGQDAIARLTRLPRD